MTLVIAVPWFRKSYQVWTIRTHIICCSRVPTHFTHRNVGKSAFRQIDILLLKPYDQHTMALRNLWRSELTPHQFQRTWLLTRLPDWLNRNHPLVFTMGIVGSTWLATRRLGAMGEKWEDDVEVATKEDEARGLTCHDRTETDRALASGDDSQRVRQA